MSYTTCVCHFLTYNFLLLNNLRNWLICIFYERANRNSNWTRWLYAEINPTQRYFAKGTFATIHQCLREYFDSALNHQLWYYKTYPHTFSGEEYARQYCWTPRKRHTQTFQNVASFVFNSNLPYPFRVQQIQSLNVEDFPSRLQFCQWILRQCSNPQFHSCFQFTDEIKSAKDSINNTHNEHR